MCLVYIFLRFVLLIWITLIIILKLSKQIDAVEGEENLSRLCESWCVK